MIIISLSFFSFLLFAHGSVSIKALIKDNKDNVYGSVSYSRTSDGVEVTVDANPGIKLAKIDEKIVTIQNLDGPTETATAMVYEFFDPASGAGVLVDLATRVYNNQKEVSQPMVKELINSSGIDESIPSEFMINTKNITKGSEISQRLPKAFQSVIYHPYSVYKNHISQNRRFFRSLEQNVYARRNQWNQFQQRVRSALGASYEDREAAVVQRIRESAAKLDLYDDEIKKFTEASLKKIIAPDHFDDPLPALTFSEDNQWREIENETMSFLNEFGASLYAPSFDGKYLDKKINFDINNELDHEALSIYIESNIQKSNLFQKNHRYFELSMAQNLIEIRQTVKNDFQEDILGRLSHMANFINEKKITNLLNMFNLYAKFDDFQKGMAASLVNNLNPLSIMHPVSANCENKWCRLGEYVGDAASLVVGISEMVGGFTITGASGAATIAAVAGGPTAFAIPATVTTAVAGMVLAGHGHSTAKNSFKSMYAKISGPKNVTQLKEANKSFGFIRNSARKLKIKTKEGIAKLARIKQSKSASKGLSGAAKHDFYKKQLRSSMPKPKVQDSTLSKVIDRHYRPNAKVGSGSTADAVRSEMLTGKPTGGRFHSEKARNDVQFLKRWLNNNPKASSTDKSAAEQVMLDLMESLGDI